MAKVRQMKSDEIPFSAPVTETEREELEELMEASVAEVSQEDMTDSRLSYPPRTPGGQKVYEELGRPMRPGIWVSRARNAGHSLSDVEVYEVYSFDGDEIVCSGRKGQCGYRFRPVRVAEVDDEGSLRTDERLICDANPRGIVHRGAYLAVPTDPKIRHSKIVIVGPICRRCQKAISAVYHEATGRWPKAFANADGNMFVAAVNEAKDAARRAWLDQKAEIAREYGIERGGNPHHATAGRQGRGGGFKFGDIAHQLRRGS